MKKRILFIAAMIGLTMTFAGCGKEDKYTTIDASLESKLIELGEYKGLLYQPEDATVTDEEVQESMDMELSWYGTYEAIPDKTVAENGDTVNISFKGIIDGAESEEASADSYDLTLGEGDMIEGFEESIVGKNVGDSITVDLVFPDDYYDTEVAGKNVTFEITLNQIEEYVEPELTDEFVKENMGYETVAAFEEATRNSLVESALEESEVAAQEALLAEIIENSKFEMNEEEVESYRESLIAEYESYAEMYGMEYGDFLEMFMETTEEDFEKESKIMAEDEIKSILVYQAIIEKEDLGITEEDYTNALGTMAEEYGYDSPEEMEADYEKTSIISDMLYQNVMDFIVENAKTQ